MTVSIRVPTGVTSITLAVSGVKSVTAGIISGVDDVEGTQLVQSYNKPRVSAMTNLTTGAINMLLPLPITSITINGNTYAVSSGLAAAVAAADATILSNQGWLENGFRPAAAN